MRLDIDAVNQRIRAGASDDLAAERRLTAMLGGLTPGVPIIGRDAASIDPKSAAALGSADEAWVIGAVDRLDNVAAGSECSAVAFVSSGETVAAWIHRPTTGELLTAERGSGAYVDGTRIQCVDDHRRADELCGRVETRDLDDTCRPLIERGLDRVGPLAPGLGSAALEYPRIIGGTLPFVFSWQTNSWDHAPGTLIVEEAGGRARRLDGSPYRVASATNPGLLVTPGPASWATVHAALLGDFGLF